MRVLIKIEGNLQITEIDALEICDNGCIALYLHGYTDILVDVPPYVAEMKIRNDLARNGFTDLSDYSAKYDAAPPRL